MSIAERYKGKNIGIINVEGILGRVLLRKILIQFGHHIGKVVIIDTHAKNEGSNNFKMYDALLRDSYFRVVEPRIITEKVQVLSMDGRRISEGRQQSEPETKNLDILYNCHQPQDLTRNTLQSCLNSHIWKSKIISKNLELNFKVNKMIMVSSLYTQNFGYVSESDGQLNTQPLGYLPQNMISPSKLKQDLTDIFSTDYQIWQWSVLYMENIFTLEAGVKSIEVVRLPLVGPTVENYQGFTSGFNTLTSLIYQLGKKNIEVLQGNSNNIIDMMPADFAVNYMIVIAVSSLSSQAPFVEIDLIDEETPENGSGQHIKQGLKQEKKRQKNKNFRIIIHNLSTSSRNPTSISKFGNYISQAWIQYSSDDYKPANFKIHQKKWQRKAYSIQQKLPNNTKSRLAHLLDIKSWKIQTQQSSITTNKKFEIIRKYRYFLQHQWICQSNKSIDYFFTLSAQDQHKFNFNVNSINWKTYAKLCCYSISKYMLGVQVEKFNPASLDLLTLQKSSYFSDIVWALTEGKPIKAQSSIQLKNYILSTKSVKQAIEQLVEEKTKKLQQTPTAYQKVEEQFYKVADQMCTQMFSQYSMNSIRGFAWFLHKVFRTIYEKVVVDKTAIVKLRNHDEKNNGPLIIIPTHRSYIDFLIMSYVFFGYGIKVPHIAAAEDFLNMAVVHILLRKSGAFFIKRDQKKYRALYKAIMSEYISKLLAQNHYLQFFVEGTRSRVGKMLDPKYGILSIVSKNVLDGKIPDAQILPVTINYQKVLEGTSFTYEMMGETKVKQSLSRLIKAVDVLKENYGRIYIQLCEPISVKNYFLKNMPKYAEKPTNQYELTLNDLGYKIVYDLTNALVITPPAIVASVILMERIGISDDRLSQKAQWLSRQITSRGIKVARTQSDSSISVSNTLALLGEFVNKSKKDMFQVQVSFDQNSFMQLFTLTYYRNTLTHIFFEEALIAVSMASFGFEEMTNCKVPLQSLKKSVIFLGKMLRKQYVLQRYAADNPDRFEQILNFMLSRGIVQINHENSHQKYVGIKNPDSNIFMFYCSLVWPVVESYWICVLYFFKLIKDNVSVEMPKLQSEIQWFGQSIFSERIILHLQAISMDTIKNATSTFKSMKVIGESKQGSSNVGIRVLADEVSLKALQRKIQSYLKSKYASSFKGTLGNGRGSVTLDFPFLSKL